MQLCALFAIRIQFHRKYMIDEKKMGYELNFLSYLSMSISLQQLMVFQIWQHTRCDHNVAGIDSTTVVRVHGTTWKTVQHHTKGWCRMGTCHDGPDRAFTVYRYARNKWL